MKLFLPCSSKNFSLIFETESISPKIFYTQRGFGNIRYKASPLDISDNYLTLYSKPYSFNFSERENYPMWLEFEKEGLQSLLIDAHAFATSLEQEKAFLYPKTIYFDASTFRCIFSDPKQLRDTRIDSESYRNVKATAKYKIEVEQPQFFKDSITSRPVQVMPNSLLGSEVEKDKRFNNFKGFLYGYVIGKLGESTPQKNSLLSLISEIQSSFTNAKSQIVVQSSGKETGFSSLKDKFYDKKFKPFKSKDQYEPPSYSISDTKSEILQLITKAEEDFHDLLPEGKTKETDCLLLKAKDILEGLQNENAELALLEECQNFIFSLSIRNNAFDLMRKAVIDFFRIATSKVGLLSPETEKRERTFKTNLKKIERKAELYFLNKEDASKGVNLNEFIFISSFQIEIDRSLMMLSEPSEYALFEIIASYILHHRGQKNKVKSQEMKKLK